MRRRAHSAARPPTPRPPTAWRGERRGRRDVATRRPLRRRRSPRCSRRARHRAAGTGRCRGSGRGRAGPAAPRAAVPRRAGCRGSPAARPPSSLWGEGKRVTGGHRHGGHATTSRAPYSLARYRPLGGAVSRSRNSAGTTVSGSGRSLMSSPGNAAWCMAVRMSPGSTAYHRRRAAPRRRCRRGGRARLARGVGPPSLVMLDSGVRRDRQDSASGRDQVREQLPGERQRRHHVGLEDGSESMRVEVRQRGLRAAAQLAGVVDEQVQGAVPAHGGSELGPVRRVGDRAGDCLDGGVAAELRRDLGEPVGTTRVEYEGPAPLGQRRGQRAAQSR